ncbi:general substrate transporter [Microdochium bolleyi]|uniref:General substrate transporter n=1 Tax=Microdochium bolleyi TaxID=196109 RepID=A0A136JGI8_9PEZI|nr:general substrate transporter [Microdochium bolleyi]
MTAPNPTSLTATTEKGRAHRDASLHHVESTVEHGLEKPSELILDASARGQATSGYEALSPWETAKTFRKATAICFATAFAAATDGYQIGINASIIANKGFVQQFATATDAKGDPFLEAPILSGWSSIMSVGQIIGMVTIPFISSRFGRKIAMYWLWSVLVTSVLAESLARSWPVWLVGKLLAGVGVGCLQSTLPTYIAEVAPVKVRGALLMSYSFWWTLGSFFAQIALQNLNTNNPFNYTTAIYTQWAQIGVMLLVFVCLPESPAWCVNRGLEQRAKENLRRINGSVPNYDVDYQYHVLSMAVEHERAVAIEQRREKWWAIFVGIDGRRTLTALWTNMAQQFIGLKLFGTFGTYFFQQAGLSQPFTIKCITSSINIATVIVSVFVADRIGRRFMACSATTLSWVSCIIIGILGVIPQTEASSYVFVLFTCLWNVGMTANGAAGWGFIGEISSQRLRPYTAGFGAATTCVVGIIMDVLVPYMVNANKWNWGFKTGWFYAGTGMIAVAGMWYLIPETANRSAAELDELFERKVKAWRFAKTETATQRLVRSNENSSDLNMRE